MNIAICGGGNIGTLMAAEFSKKGNNVTIYTSNKSCWSNTIAVYDNNDILLFETDIFKITDNLKEAVCNAEIVFVTFPAFMFKDFADKLLPIVEAGQKICVVPGGGGVEFAFKKIIDKGCILFGFQRVHSIARLKEYGHSVYMLGRKSQLQIAAIPNNQAEAISEVIGELFDMECVTLPNYLSVTLTPSNPILHTTRLYSLFKDYRDNIVYPEEILFYESWDNDSSENLILCDSELQKLCDAIPMDLAKVKSLKKHYEIETVQQLTDKISGIKAFKGIITPMKRCDNGFVPDFESRYFTADFSFGLKIICDIAHLFDVKVPNIEKIWKWYVNLPLKQNPIFLI